MNLSSNVIQWRVKMIRDKEKRPASNTMAGKPERKKKKREIISMEQLFECIAACCELENIKWAWIFFAIEFPLGYCRVVLCVANDNNIPVLRNLYSFTQCSTIKWAVRFSVYFSSLFFFHPNNHSIATRHRLLLIFRISFHPVFMFAIVIFAWCPCPFKWWAHDGSCRNFLLF